MLNSCVNNNTWIQTINLALGFIPGKLEIVVVLAAVETRISVISKNLN